MEHDAGIAAAVFALVVALDWAWARYIKAAADGNKLKAATWSLWIYLLGGCVTLEYVSNHWLLPVAALASFVGTYIGTHKE